MSLSTLIFLTTSSDIFIKISGYFFIFKLPCKLSSDKELTEFTDYLLFCQLILAFKSSKYFVQILLSFKA